MESHYGTSSYAYQDSATRVQAQIRLTQLEQQTRHSKGGDASLTLTPQDSLQAFAMARDKADRVKEEASLYIDTDDAQFYQFRTLHQEWHRKFTFPVSCIIFALIGSSLGAIVRRGGIGMPIIISIFFFVVYFIIDSFGTNMLRNESIPIWLGMWLSNIVLFPVGIFLAYKANQDSSALNVEVYVIFFRKLFGFRGVRKVEYQELIIEEADYKAGALAVAQALKHTDALLQGSLFSGRIWSIWTRGAEQKQLATLSQELDDITESLRHTPSRLLVSKLCDLPLLPTRLSPFLPEEARWGRILGALLPLSLPFGLFLSRVRTHLRADLRTTRTVLLQIADEVAAADKSSHTPPLG